MKMIVHFGADYMSPRAELLILSPSAVICTSGNGPDSSFESLNDPTELTW